MIMDKSLATPLLLVFTSAFREKRIEVNGLMVFELQLVLLDQFIFQIHTHSFHSTEHILKMMRRNVLRWLTLVKNGREIVLKKGSLMIIVMMMTIVTEMVLIPCK
jgi:hypothetical protein